MSMERWNPYREMMTLRDAMSQLFEDAMIMPRSGAAPSTWDLALDVKEDEDNFVLQASVPGLNPEDLDITVTENVVTIKGEIKSDEETKNERYHMRERRYGTFSRSVSLPMPVKSDQAEANYSNGILTLRLPKTEEVKPKRIQIKSGGQKMIEGESSKK